MLADYRQALWEHEDLTDASRRNYLSDFHHFVARYASYGVNKANNPVLSQVRLGLTNPSYKDGSFVLRIANEIDYDLFAIEQWAMQEVRRRGVPVANILTQGSVVERDEVIYYQLQEKLAGEPTINCSLDS